MSTTNWLDTVHRNADSKQNRLQLLNQHIDELNRDGREREEDLALMRALHAAMQAIKAALQRLQSRWKCYNRKKKQPLMAGRMR